jgi:hypothetical protein
MVKEVPIFQEEKEPQAEKLPPAEAGLRERVLTRVISIDDKRLGEIGQLFNSINIEHGPNDIKNGLTNAINTAKLGGNWCEGSPEEGKEHEIEIGYYANENEYFTRFMHEVGHSLLRQVGYPDVVRSEEWEQEEDLCWRFSELSCRLLELPYSKEIEKLCREDCHLYWHYQDYSEKELKRRRETLIEKERGLRGFSEDAGDRFHFTPQGIPIIER